MIDKCSFVISHRTEIGAKKAALQVELSWQERSIRGEVAEKDTTLYARMLDTEMPLRLALVQRI